LIGRVAVGCLINFYLLFSRKEEKMNFRIGQKLAYPNLGVCSVECVENKQLGANNIEVYSLKLLADESLIFVPTANAGNVRLRPVINSFQCGQLMQYLSESFIEISSDWKVRSREFSDKIQSGDVFQAADVLKKLNYLNHQKQLSFREQRTFEKANFLVVSELATACSQPECQVANKVEELLNLSYEQFMFEQTLFELIPIVSAAAN
jgi:CarD family transcriptional regulator